jgi:uroporphyrinogen III methyltransferase/synthase
MKGKVYVVGAGPGDIGLLTIKGLHCIQIADVVVYDFHINAQMLNYAKRDAEFIYAGKRGGHHELSQDEINRLLVEKALEGKIVCRLKGGDPFVFGRGGEEIQELRSAGVAYEIIPGISSAIAAPAYAGIPLTHRGLASSVAIITGCETPSKGESIIKWDKIATATDTLVFLMAIRNLDCVAENLISHGKSPQTPVAVVRWGTRPEQKVVIGTLATIVDQIKAEEITPPSVVVVGDVVKLREELKWYEAKPLFGHRVLITRQYNEKYDRLQELGAEVIELPTIEIVPPDNYDDLDRCIRSINVYHWLVFTSANAVKFFFKRYRELDLDIRDIKGLNICCIGQATAKEARVYGVKIDLIPEEFNAEGLVDNFQNPKDLRFLLPRAEIARELFPEKIRELGGSIDAPIAYRTIAPLSVAKVKRLKRFLKEGRITVATFTSAQTFHNFRDVVGEDFKELLHNVAIAAIGPVTAKAIEKTGLQARIVPKDATIEAMVDAIIEQLQQPLKQWITL